MKSSKYIAAVVIAGFVLIGYLFYVSPSTAPGQLPAVLVAIGVLAKLFDTDGKVETVVAKVDTVDTKVDNSVAVSKGNALALAVVSEQTAQALEQQAQQTAQISQQVDDNTKVTEATQGIAQETLVMADGHLTNALEEGRVLREKIDRLEGFVSALLQEKAVKMNEQTHEGGLDRIATAIELVVPALAPPKDTEPDL